MITESGALCDVCGHYILPLREDERVNHFRVPAIPVDRVHSGDDR